jgi:hypothetical protein
MRSESNNCNNFKGAIIFEVGGLTVYATDVTIMDRAVIGPKRKTNITGFLCAH